MITIAADAAQSQACHQASESADQCYQQGYVDGMDDSAKMNY